MRFIGLGVFHRPRFHPIKFFEFGCDITLILANSVTLSALLSALHRKWTLSCFKTRKVNTFWGLKAEKISPFISVKLQPNSNKFNAGKLGFIYRVPIHEEKTETKTSHATVPLTPFKREPPDDSQLRILKLSRKFALLYILQYVKSDHLILG